jgi:protein dithiol:quinone oxidoreductase
MNQSRNLLLLIAAACVTALSVALYAQHYKDMLPCPLCVIQRYLFMALTLACLIGAAIGKPKLGAAVGLAAALGGIGVAAKHLYVLAHPGLSCGIDPLETSLNKVFTARLLPYVFRADGLCEDATAPFFGLSMPQWTLVGFGTSAVLLIWILARRRP